MRFCYFSYFKDVPLSVPSRGMVWLSDPDVAYVHPNDESGRRFSPIEKLVYSTAARDAELAGQVEDLATRSLGGIAATWRMIARAALVRLGLGG